VIQDQSTVKRTWYFLNITLPDDWSTFQLKWAKLQEEEKEAILRRADETCSYKIYEDSYKIYENCFWNIKISWIPHDVKRVFIYFEKLPFHFHFMYRLRVFPSFRLDRGCCFTQQSAGSGNLYYGGTTVNETFHLAATPCSYLRHSASSLVSVYLFVDIKYNFYKDNIGKWLQCRTPTHFHVQCPLWWCNEQGSFIVQSVCICREMPREMSCSGQW
jgi:hypothetical protein